MNRGLPRGSALPIRLLASAAALALLTGCGGDEPAEEGVDFFPGDSLAVRPESAQMIDLTGGLPCAAADENPGRLAVQAAWEGDHVRVAGAIEGGAGNALSLGLSQDGSFVYDEVFRSELLSVINLETDSLDATSVSYEPTGSEAAAFGRTGAVALDPARPVCLDITLYERGDLDRLASRSLQVAGEAPARTE